MIVTVAYLPILYNGETMKKILLVEDDLNLGATLQDYLEVEAFDVTWVKDGQQALDATYAKGFDLLLLDVNVPFINGFELLDALRQSGDSTPAVFITALTDIDSLAKGFNVGADDYIKKPFDIDEMVVRIRAAINKSLQARGNVIRCGTLHYEVTSDTLYKNEERLALPPYEHQLLTLFLKRNGKIVTKEEILFEVGNGDEMSEGALRVHVSHLKKLGIPIENIRGVGYRCEFK